MKLNVTIEVSDEASAHACISWLEQTTQVHDWSILTDTKKMYEQNTTYKKLCKEYTKAKRAKNDYINEHNYKYS